MISLIVSTYEHTATLGWVLEALASQDYPGRWELIVVDDGSDPTVLTIVKEASWRYSTDMRYVWQPDAGHRLARSRNNGIRIARGELLVFLDGDMVVRPNFLSAHAAAHASGEKILLVGTRERLVVRSDRQNLDLEALRVQAEQVSIIEGLPTEHKQQEAWSRSRSPWMAMSGSNFSIASGPGAMYNEMFFGWGSEDRELACSLIRRHGHKLVVSDAPRALHVKVESRPTRRGALITSAAANAAEANKEAQALLETIRNKLVFKHLHPTEDVTPTMRMIANCLVDPRTDTWYFDEDLTDRNLAEAINAAENWMDSHSIQFRPARRATPTPRLTERKSDAGEQDQAN